MCPEYSILAEGSRDPARLKLDNWETYRTHKGELLVEEILQQEGFLVRLVSLVWMKAY